MDGNFPKMLYKRGDEHVIFEDLKVDTKIVKSDVELAEALAEGWHDDPAALNKLHYQEGGDPPTAEGGYPADHQWDKGLEGQRGRADRYPQLPEAKAKEARDAKGYLYPPGNPPREEDPSVPPTPAETKGADALKKHPGAATEKAEKEFAKQAEEEEGQNFGDRRDKNAKGDPDAAAVRESNMRENVKEAEERRGPGRPPKRD